MKVKQMSQETRTTVGRIRTAVSMAFLAVDKTKIATNLLKKLRVPFL
jgi:hypothetical protein